MHICAYTPGGLGAGRYRPVGTRRFNSSNQLTRNSITSEAFGITGELGGKNLDRDLAAEPRVLGQVHLAHAAHTERFENLVMT